MLSNSWRVREADPREMLTEANVQKAIDALLSYRTREVLWMAASVWAFFLGSLFTLLLTIRLAYAIPLL